MWSSLTDSTGFSPIFPNWPSTHFGFAVYPQDSPEF